ncbi:MAG TPA: UDP-N-acetylmuramoyl-tripeptide--D-alanyl-D-alanine ligase [Clostridiales bacterium]|nr:UDP-N-acetylmuramoyl-tripeptide--D-alanyl-D-alanine ligase [Clostridiales bacterium]
METMSIREIADALNGKLINYKEDIMIKGISTDSRKIKKDDLFIPIKGLNFDGHDFIQNAIDSGACAVLSQYNIEPCNFTYILVEDTQSALIKLAQYYKKKFEIPSIAVTGSSGKTTTKEMIASVLSEKFDVLKNEGNLNNNIGLPISVFRLEKHHDICVFEMGMNKPGEIETLASIVKPDIAVITNIGTAHIGYFGSRENILKAKKEVFTFFTKNNIAVLNGDDDMLSTITDTDFKIIRYGLKEYNHLRAKDIKQREDMGMEFTVNIDGREENFFIPLLGVHNVYNALSAIAVGLTMNMEIESIRRGLQNFVPAKMRMEIYDTKDNIKIINDSYNANPDSAIAAIEVLKSMPSSGRKVLIIGDMLELGDYTVEGHRKVGEKVAESNIEVLITIGEKAKEVINGALSKGMNKEQIYSFKDNEDAISKISSILATNDVVLIKGSRMMKLEEIVDYLIEGRYTKDE